MNPDELAALAAVIEAEAAARVPFTITLDEPGHDGPPRPPGDGTTIVLEVSR